METTEEGVVEMGEMERSLTAAQEMICGVMISKAMTGKAVPQPWLYHVTITTRLSHTT